MRFALIVSLAGLFCATLVAVISAEPKLPQKFTAVDTSRLMGSPDPLPLEAERVFPKLKFQRPVELTHAGDGTGRIFVVEQAGVIRVFDERRQDIDNTTVFLDIREIVLSKGNEEGLLGLAFHPKYKQNGIFFIYYCAKPRKNVLARYRVSRDDPNRADPKSEVRLIEIDDPYENHNGGSIRFGTDGYLYVGLGDGGLRDDPHGHAQDLSTLLGSILRIDVDHKDRGLEYAIPKDNPFADRRGARGEIWAYGLRNVWRIAVDRETGDLWAGDVGQDRFEEINLIERGGNYGWNLREAMHDFIPTTPHKRADLIDPLVEYFRHDGASVTGGLVYRGPRLEAFAGAYFYGDYISGNVWALTLDKQKKVKQNRLVARTGLGIAAFGEDERGEMYLCAFDGHLYQLHSRDQSDRDGKAFPGKLSETGLFASVKDNVPAVGLIPYEVNLPFWSDYAVKDRYIALPATGKVRFDPEKKWEFPVGTVFVKTFWMHRDRAKLKDPQRLETRLFVHAPDGWVGYTYVYNDDQTDAELLGGPLTKSVKIENQAGNTIDQQYPIPARNDCFACHTKQEGFVLGLTTRQMNRELNYYGDRANQIELLEKLGVFEEKIATPKKEWEAFPDWGFGNFDRDGDDEESNTLDPPKGDADKLARAWLEVNCAVCHRPQGIAPRERDMRFHTPLGKTNMLDVTPKHGQMSGTSGKVIKPGDPHESELFRRATFRGGLGQMPPLSTRYADERGMATLRRWIEGLKE